MLTILGLVGCLQPIVMEEDGNIVVGAPESPTIVEEETETVGRGKPHEEQEGQYGWSSSLLVFSSDEVQTSRQASGKKGSANQNGKWLQKGGQITIQGGADTEASRIILFPDGTWVSTEAYAEISAQDPTVIFMVINLVDGEVEEASQVEAELRIIMMSPDYEELGDMYLVSFDGEYGLIYSL